MTGAEVKAMKDEELSVELGRLRTRLFELRKQSVSEKIEDNSQIGKIRRDVARILGEQHARRASETSA